MIIKQRWTFFTSSHISNFRTKSVRKKIGEVLATITSGYDFSRLRNLFCHCFADIFGGSLFVDRKIFDIVFLENQNGEFITGDQPGSESRA